MWAEVPWGAGHYVVNAPMWVTAHYTQATEVGWSYLPVGSGSGMLPKGGSYVGLVSAGGCGATKTAKPLAELTLIIQTMAYNNSQCFKDTHPEFEVETQTAEFAVDEELLARLRQRGQPGEVVLSVRRTQLVPGDPIDPVRNISPATQQNRYFEPEQDIVIKVVAGGATFSVELGVNQVVTLSTVLGAGNKGGPDSTGKDRGIAAIANSTAWPQSMVTADLTGAGLGSPLIDRVLAMDQQGVWESAPSRDPGINTTMQQVIQEEPDEWHGWGKIVHPQTFIGPAANPVGQPSTITSVVMPPASGWAGVGFGGQVSAGSSVHPGPGILAVWANSTWACGTATGAVPAAAWYNLSMTLLQGQGAASSWTATINGATVDTGSRCSMGAGPDGALSAASSAPPFGFLAASYHGTGAAAEFRSVGLSITAASASAPPPPPGPSPPGPPGPPVPPGVLAKVACASGDPRQLFVFSGEDGYGNLARRLAIFPGICCFTPFNSSMGPALRAPRDALCSAHAC